MISFRIAKPQCRFRLPEPVDPKEQRSSRKIQTVASAASATVHDNLIGIRTGRNKRRTTASRTPDPDYRQPRQR
jgi:hypothetical protein